MLGTIEWQAFVEQRASGTTVACSAVLLSSPPACSGGTPVEGLDLAAIPEAENPSDLQGFYYLRDVYLEASVRQEGGHLVLTVLDYDLERPRPEVESIECDPDAEPDPAGAIQAYFDLTDRVEDPNVTVGSGERGVLEVFTLVTTPEIVDRVCELSEVPIVIMPLALTTSPES